MDETGSDPAKNGGETVSPSTTNPAAELNKRRSTRIAQAAPLLVTGVDALGRPFQERTSTLAINCHGCRYQSRHYVLRSMWVTLQIPHQEDSHPPSTVRGRVAWIQRPRAGRQLFQIALEHEVPGNIWGIAFPPQDWFPFPDAEAAALSLAAVQPAELPEGESEMSTLLNPEGPAEEMPENLRVFPAPAGSDASLLHAAGVQEAVERLAGSRSLLDAAVAQQEAKIRSITEEAFAAALARFREQSGAVEMELQDSAQTIVARNLAELEDKASDLNHAAVDSLYKSAEWYEKKAQIQLQQIIEKGVELAGQQLRERAGEIAGVFATEIDGQSRNFVDHAQRQMEEILRECIERSRALFTEAAETTSSTFTDEIQRQAREELDGFGEALKKTVEEGRIQAEGVARELGAQMTAEQESFLERFQSNMTNALETGVAAAQQQVQGGLDQVVESWEAMAREEQQKLFEIYTHIGDESVEQFRGRLENMSNSWMLATVTTLDRQSRDVLSSVAQAAEEKLRETCAQVFATVGETLRERLKEISAAFTGPGTSNPSR
jgi:hypothetical protein